MARTLYIAEGPTDCAALIDIGFEDSIGRPSCSGGIPLILELSRQGRFQRAVIVSDNDEPGVAGAKLLMENLSIPSCIIVPPTKDLREFVVVGGNHALLESLIGQSIWHNP